ncbi:cupin domain-containing protein [Rhizobiaceae bacterium n13]|uniref:Cupin domain-containing protein n=1 Tax=Ferirhizobium litorale TaxID=2927786 RepID=A0AAE3QFH5_9HYPH|nr:cupin domain-containing protein [Fererhizobium litorale]MDI7864652.1 cupin domain-containing protein [Fererhizobium litorale]MDI7922143.1 cupin domain-containing protein [Fererhizobium litorale]
MKSSSILITALLAVGLSTQAASAQQGAIGRTDLVQEPISAQGHEVVQVRVDFEAGAVSIKHNHPGEEVAYVLEGTLEYQLEGRQPVTLTAGQSLFIPDGVAHVARNVGSGKASELATYIVRSGEKIFAPVK